MQSERVLAWLKPNYLGDAVMATPLLRTLAQNYGTLDMRIGPLLQNLLGNRIPGIDSIEAPPLSPPSAFMRYVRWLRSQRYSTVFLVERSARAALIARLAKIPIRIGHSTEGRGLLLTHAVRYDLNAFEADCYLDLARKIGLEVDKARPSLNVTEEEVERGKSQVASGSIGIQPGARHLFKQLPYESMAKVIHELTAMGLPLVLVGGKDDLQHEKILREQLNVDLPSLVGKCELSETMGVLKHLKMVVGSDTGLMHIAAAVGCPTVTVFGKITASKWGHAYPPHQVIPSPKDDPRNLDPQVVVHACQQVLSTVHQT